MAASLPPKDAENLAKSGPWTDLGLTLPIFVGYHLGVVFLPMRNAADVVTRELVTLANDSLLAYGGLTLAIGATYVGILAMLGRGRALHWDRFVTVALEGIIYAVAMRLSAIYVVGQLFVAPGSGTVAQGGVLSSTELWELVPGAVNPLLMVTDGGFGARFAGLIMSFGAGFYEEVAFRVIAFGLGLKLVLLLFPQPIPLQRALTAAGWAVLVAVVFSGWHYVGPYGDPFDARSFVFRAVCGVIFTIIYHFRGFAPAVWTHALYDAWVLVL
ncbi:MAG: CPBP family intramembrane metalloprotease [Myxococcales bacterium]|nr:CPBP family intramembrane metalloprotease [Myxococcales bacterium]